MGDLFNNPTLTILIGIVLGAFASRAMLDWALKNGRSIGRMIAKKVPGDALEKWLLEFMKGVADGLKAEMEEDDEKASVATPAGANITLSKAKLRR